MPVVTSCSYIHVYCNAAGLILCNAMHRSLLLLALQNRRCLNLLLYCGLAHNQQQVILCM